MGRAEYSQSSQLSTLVGKPVSRYTKLPKNTDTLRKLTDIRAKPNNRFHYSIYPSVEREYQASYSQLANLDFYSPVITILGDNPYSHLLNTPFTDPGFILDETSTLVSNVSTVNTNAYGTYDITYVATDGINPDTTRVRVVKVGEYPVVTIEGDNPYTLERYDPYNDEGVTYDANSSVTSTTSSVNNTVVGTYTVNYTVSNPVFTSFHTRIVNVVDTTPPVVTILGDNPYTLERFGVYTDPGAVGDLGTIVTPDLSNVQNTSIGSFVVVYNATDGNTLHDVAFTRTVNVVDTVPPVITVLGDDPFTLERFDVYTDPGATSDLGTIVTPDLSNVQNTSVGSFVVVYNATDGNTAHDVVATRTVNVVDTVPPVITLLGDNPYEMQPGIDFRDVDPLYEVDLGTTVSIDYSNVVTTDNSSFFVVYRASDGVNPDAVVLRRVAVADTLPAIITIIGDNPYTLERYAEYVDPGATTDTESGSRFVSITNNVDNTAVGSYTVTYVATDDVNIPPTTAERIVNVVDTTAPIVTLNGASNVTLERYGVFADIDEGVEIEAPGSLVSVDTSKLDNTTQGAYPVKYIVVDDQNNSNEITRWVDVVDTVPPVVTLNNASTNYTMERNGVWADIDPGVTLDAGSELIGVNVDNTAVGVVTVQYVVTDGNVTTYTPRNIFIVDTTPPIGSIANPSYQLERFGIFNDPGVENLDAGTYLAGTDTSNVDNTLPHNSTFDVIYDLGDDVSNTALIRTVTVVDNTLPTGTINNPTFTLERFGVYSDPVPGVINLDQGSYIAGIDLSNVDNTLPHNSTFDVIYDLGDDVNNTFLTRTVTVVDNTLPTATINNPTFTLERFGVYSDPVPGVINLDQGSYIAGIDLSNVDNTLPHNSTFDVIYDLGDDVNNTFLTRTVTVVDNTRPTGTINNPTFTLERFGVYSDPVPGVINLDQGSYIAGIDFSNVDNTLPHNSTFDVIYDLGDDVNNTFLTRTVTVLDNTRPTGTINNPTFTLERFGVYNDPVPGVINLDQGSYIAGIDLSNVDNTLPHNSTFDVIYDLGDDVSNTILIRTVTVLDNTLPSGSIANPSYQLERFGVFNDLGVENLDAGTYLAGTDTSNVDNTLPHNSTFDVIYDLGDDVSNTILIRTVTVVDTLNPQLVSLVGYNPYYTPISTDYNEDGILLDEGSEYTYSSPITTTSGSKTVTYTATDTNPANSSTFTRSVQVEPDTYDTPVASPTQKSGIVGCAVDYNLNTVVVLTKQSTSITQTFYMFDVVTSTWSESTSITTTPNSWTQGAVGAFTRDGSIFFPSNYDKTLGLQPLSFNGTSWVAANSGTGGSFIPTWDPEPSVYGFGMSVDVTLNTIPGTNKVMVIAGERAYDSNAGRIHLFQYELSNNTFDSTYVSISKPSSDSGINFGRWVKLSNNGSRFFTASSAYIYVYSNNGVGIGTSSSDWSLQAVINTSFSNPILSGVSGDGLTFITRPVTGYAKVYKYTNGTWSSYKTFNSTSLAISISEDASYIMLGTSVYKDYNSTYRLVGSIGTINDGLQMMSPNGERFIWFTTADDNIWYNYNSSTSSYFYTYNKRQYIQPITITGDVITNISINSIYTDAGATTNSAYSIQSTVSTVNNTQIGTYTVTYTATDSLSSVATAVRQVNVITDVTAPSITLIGYDPLSVDRYTEYVDPGATTDTGETVSINTNNVDTTTVGEYNVALSATDIAGNISTASRSVFVTVPEYRQQRIQASDKDINDYFGTSVSIDNSGNYAIVGAHGEDADGYNDAGAAYILKRIDGVWSEEVKLVASDKDIGDYFGYSVAISGDGTYAIVGAKNENSVGAAYVFNRVNGIWSEQQKLTASTQTNDDFGCSVSINDDGTTIIIGAENEDTSGSDAGAAYVFTRSSSGTTWSQQQKLLASDKGQSDKFGGKVSVSGDGTYAIIGAKKENSVGAAYVFNGVNGIWSEQQKLTASTHTNDDFGCSVSINDDGTTAIIGAENEDTSGSDAGAAYVFTRSSSGTTWSQQQKLLASDKGQSDKFGGKVSVSKDGSCVIVGAKYESGGRGAAYVFNRVNGTWYEQQKIQAIDAQASDNFGSDVSVSEDGTYVIIGSNLKDAGNNTNTGAVYLARKRPEYIEDEKLTGSLTSPGSNFGWRTELSYDGTIAAVGSRGDDSAYVFIYSIDDGWTQQAILTGSDTVSGDWFGFSIAISGDGNTILVSAPNHNSYSGAVYVFTYSGTAWTQQSKLTPALQNPVDVFGWFVTISYTGNTLMVGSVGSDPNNVSAAGAAYLFTRNATGWTEESILYASDGEENDFFGRVALSPDGYTLIVGAPLDDHGTPTLTDAGSVYLFSRSLYGVWSEQAKLTADIPVAGERFGEYIAISYDGNTAVAVAMTNDSARGAVYVFVRSGSNWSQQAKLVASDAELYDLFGTYVSISHDGNTIIVGAMNTDTLGTNSGSVYIFTRLGTTWREQQKITASDGHVESRFGASCFISGDGNTIISGAYTSDSSTGSAYIFKYI